jgi:predicted amidohydrolase YtcJ
MGLNPRSWSLFAPRFDGDGSNPADLVVVNARVFTSDASRPSARAVAVKASRIVFVGDDKGVADFVGPETRVVNGRDRVLTPGFIDNHCHVLWIGALLAMMTTDLFFCESADEIREVVLRHASKHPDSLIVFAQGWKPHCLPGGAPTLELLDSWIADRPVALMSFDATGWVNSKMLELLWERNRPAFERLVPETDESGRYNGLIRHFHPFNPLDFASLEELGPGIKDRMFEMMTKSLDDALAVGVTTMDDCQIYGSFVPLVREFRDRGGLEKCRVRCTYYVHRSVLDDEDAFRAELARWKELERESNPHAILGRSVKLYIDGVASNHSSFQFDPYYDEPEMYGDPVYTQEQFDRLVEIVDSMGLQCCTHCCGDAGINRVINSYERALKLHGDRDMRHRADHCTSPIPEDVDRMARLKVYAALQPTHFFGSQTSEKILGPERLPKMQPWRSMEKAGVEMSFGSDWCAGPLNPVYGLLIASTRLNWRLKNDWGPEEKIDIVDAVSHWTLDSAKALKVEDDLGSIEVGKYADFVLFNTSPLKLSSWWFLLTHKLEMGAMDNYVDTTVVDGRIVYQRDGSLL